MTGKKKLTPKRNKKPRKAARHHPKWKPPPDDQIIDIKGAEEVAMREAIALAVASRVRSGGLEDPYRNCSPRELRDKAIAGDKNALDKLVRLPTEFITVLNEIAADKPELLRPIARRSSTWPVLGSTSPLVVKSNVAIYGNIELAADVGKTAGWLQKETVITKETVQKRWAFSLLFFIQALQAGNEMNRQIEQRLGSELREAFNLQGDSWKAAQIRNLNLTVAFNMVREYQWPLDSQKYTSTLLQKAVELPALSGDPTVIDEWWSVAYELLMLNTDDAPQDIPELRAVGACQTQHGSSLKSFSDPTFDAEPYDPAKVEKRIRGKILTDLKEEFGRIARQLAKAKSATAKKSKKVEAV